MYSSPVPKGAQQPDSCAHDHDAFAAGPREAAGPIERLVPGARRDHVALLVASPTRGLLHERFDRLGDHLSVGDVVVVNDSATLPAALDARWEGTPLRIHISAPVAGSTTRLVEFRKPRGFTSVRSTPPPQGSVVELVGGGSLTVSSGPLSAAHDRLREAALDIGVPLEAYVAEWGEPIRYPYVSHPWPIEDYQTIFARVPGSSEMPSAGRPFSRELVAGLGRAGVRIVSITLHTGVASLERGEVPSPEPFAVTAEAAEALNTARSRGNRIIATGTSVVRALESSLSPRGTFVSCAGFASVLVHPRHPASTVDGLITGWHDDDATHLLMLEAIAGRRLLRAAYSAAKAHGYRWHEFGDSNLILREDRRH